MVALTSQLKAAWGTQGRGHYAYFEERRSPQSDHVHARAGKMPAIAALAYHRASGREVSTPNQRLSYSENFLYMLDAANKPSYRCATAACSPPIIRSCVVKCITDEKCPALCGPYLLSQLCPPNQPLSSLRGQRPRWGR